jgi:predicted nucleic acid-binding protein
MVIVDSSVWIDALWGTANPQSIWLNAAIGREQIGLTSLIVCEVLQGVRNENQFRGFQHDLLQLPVFEAISTQLAIASAQNYRTLRNRGITVRKAVDCVIATFCIEQSYQLLHRDRDFDAFEDHLGLRVLHPPAIPLN